ncbi:putative udp-rhamnose:rhamnosyltransferase 1 [Quercus suber]|uniref:Udp-rhamnose:rhamnosyltransferase 1 n=1 Tax=Quercus suber TaxID=58331 RepID=A0AAW0LM91_QUESU
MVRDRLHVVMLPFSAFGHMIPFFQLSIALAKAGVHVSYVSTPRNIQRLPKIPPNLATFIDLVGFPLPTLQNGVLTEGSEATTDFPQEKLNQLPDWIIIDFFPHWAVEIAQDHNIRLVFFTVMSAATSVFLGKPPGFLFLSDQTPAWRSPESLTKPPEWVSFPSSVGWREYEAPFVLSGLYADGVSGMSDAARLTKVLRSCNAFAIRSCKEFEGEYLNLHEKLMAKPVISVGWGSVIETLQFGHSLVVLPLVYDQSLNASLLVDKHLAVEVERGKDGSFNRDGIANALRLAMVSDEGEAFRVRAREASAIFGDENLHQQHYIGQFVEYLKHGSHNIE